MPVKLVGCFDPALQAARLHFAGRRGTLRPVRCTNNRRVGDPFTCATRERYANSRAIWDSSGTDTVKTNGSLQSAARPAAFVGHLGEPNLHQADSAIITVSEAAGTHIEATYKIWTTQNGAIDSVSGAISWHQAIINTK